jgi:hypothetical protein
VKSILRERANKEARSNQVVNTAFTIIGCSSKVNSLVKSMTPLVQIVAVRASVVRRNCLWPFIHWSPSAPRSVHPGQSSLVALRQERLSGDLERNRWEGTRRRFALVLGLFCASLGAGTFDACRETFE